MSIASKTSMFENANPPDAKVSNPPLARKGSGTAAGPKDPLSQPRSLGRPKSPMSPATPLPPKRMIPQIKSDREEADVLPPEERLKLHRESVSMGADRAERVIPKIKSDREEVDVLPPEERRKLALQKQPEGPRLIPKIKSDREEPDVLSPEERRSILARERAALENASQQGSQPPSRKSSVAGSQRSHHTPSVASQQSAPSARPPVTPVKSSLAATPAVRSPITPAFPISPVVDFSKCPNCNDHKAAISQLESQVTTLKADLSDAKAATRKLETKGKDGTSKAAKKHKDEISKKDATIARLEQEVREADKRAVAAAMSKNVSNPTSDTQQAQFNELLSAKDDEIAKLKQQLADFAAHEDETETMSESASLISQADNEVALLNSQIWSLETAIEFRTKDIDRLQGLLNDFVHQVEHLDTELAMAMKQLMDKGTKQAKQEELSVLGKPIEEVVSEMKQKRTDVKQKRRRPKKGKLSKENTTLREENGDLREEIQNLKKAMASGNPQVMIQAFERAQRTQHGGVGTAYPSSMMFGGFDAIPNSEVSAGMKACCFKAAFVAAGEAEAQIEKLRSKIKDKDAKLLDLRGKLDAARHAIVSSAGMGYENELKLQQARKALMLAADSPASPGRGGSASPGGVSTACPEGARSISPLRDNSITRSALAWMSANPQHQLQPQNPQNITPRRASSAVWDSSKTH
eukprot:TRINITY_DN1394_c2_g1_i1.p1 TRINITY_DN1394_c2_g1~~TRINITY_DN1394_c2_g1_i1.p1  ORF type:complete len:724 (+),score=195.75 TRINITY_DN1394_c2_g1_i1:90-2174(+)